MSDQPSLYTKILRQIKRLEQKIVELSSYQDEQFVSSTVEYVPIIKILEYIFCTKKINF
ncbi:hypothetical protein REIS_1884 [Rickettsia endosymbiont of Ixodes scapularis]|nr:hypothetical protein REIS_1884 [Rickettsia endosymbiont of Ixodes scapularis]